jgi:hypothetical protein
MTATNVINLLFINEQQHHTTLSLIYDSDLSVYKGSISMDYKFPLLGNLTLLQQLNAKSQNKSYEMMFSCNEKDIMRVFLYEERQRMYSNKHKSIRINEQFIYDILYGRNCDEATLYFDGNSFDFIYQSDEHERSCLNRIWSFVTSLPAKVAYVVFLSYEAYNVCCWLSSVVDHLN